MTCTVGMCVSILGNRVRTRAAGEGGSRWLGIQVEPCLLPHQSFSKVSYQSKLQGNPKRTQCSCGPGLIQYHNQSDTVHLHCVIPISSNYPNGAPGSTEEGFRPCPIAPAGVTTTVDLANAWNNTGLLGQFVRNRPVSDSAPERVVSCCL